MVWEITPGKSGQCSNSVTVHPWGSLLKEDDSNFVNLLYLYLMPHGGVIFMYMLSLGIWDCSWDCSSLCESHNALQLGISHPSLSLSLSVSLSTLSAPATFIVLSGTMLKGRSSVMSCLAALKSKFCISWRRRIPFLLKNNRLDRWMHACMFRVASQKTKWW